MSAPAQRRRVEPAAHESERRQRVENDSVDASEGMLGRVIAGKYVLESVVGDGSCGVVYRATQLALDKIVAVKILHRAMSADPAIAQRFHREARAASRLDHPSSIRVFDFGVERDGLLYLVMEHVEGRDLLSVMSEARRLEPRRIAIILGQVLAALAVAHDQGIVHRDLKPENILVSEGLTDDGEKIDVVKVCDFGIAALATAGDAEAMRLTGRGLVVGTPEYMSPEQARGLPLDGRSDLYAVGAVLYHLLVGRVPFVGETPVATAILHVTGTVIAPSRMVGSIDPVLEAICLRALAKEPAERFANAREMRAALREVLASADARPRPSVRPATERVTTAAPTRHAWLVVPVAMAIALAVGVFISGRVDAYRNAKQRARFERAAEAARIEPPSAVPVTASAPSHPKATKPKHK